MNRQLARRTDSRMNQRLERPMNKVYMVMLLENSMLLFVKQKKNCVVMRQILTE